MKPTGSLLDSLEIAAHCPSPSGVFGRTRPAGGAGSGPCLTHERVAVARQSRQQTEALDEYFLKQLKKTFLKDQVSGQGQVKGQNGHFLPYWLGTVMGLIMMGYCDGTVNS